MGLTVMALRGEPLVVGIFVVEPQLLCFLMRIGNTTTIPRGTIRLVTTFCSVALPLQLPAVNLLN